MTPPAPRPDTPDEPGSEPGSYASAFAARRDRQGLRILRPGRRAALATAAVVACAALGTAATLAVRHLGGGPPDRPTAQAPVAPAAPAASHPAASTSPAPHASRPAAHHHRHPGAGEGTGGVPAAGVPAAPVTTVTAAAPPQHPAEPPAGRPPFTGALITNFGSNLCIAARGGSSAPGTRLVIAGCDTSDPSQGWTFDGGTVRDFGGTRCMDVSGGPGDGAPVIIATCSASRNTTQAFTLKSSYDLVDVTPDLCVDAKNKQTSAGTVLQLWSCAGTPNQKWKQP